MSIPSDVILLRSADEPDRYVEAFREVGLRAVCESVLSFRFPNQSTLGQYLDQRSRYSALVATSPRVGVALSRAFLKNKQRTMRWRDARAYAVGPKTAAALRDVGLRPVGQEGGTARDLAHRIIRNEPDAPVLFLCGNRRRDVLPDKLTEADIPFDELVVYETGTRSDLSIPPPEGHAWLVFFSPSGLEAVQKNETIELDDYCIAAIGPTTARALEDESVTVDCVAREPSPEGLVSAIRSTEKV